MARYSMVVNKDGSVVLHDSVYGDNYRGRIVNDKIVSDKRLDAALISKFRSGLLK